jgi:hypothetical protein
MASELERFLESQSNRPDFSSDGITPEYMVVLNHFWNQRFEEAADHASAILATSPEHPATLRFYRAWIEALAELDDVESLEALGSHLLTVGRVQADKRAGFMALRGIIHLHLDQVPAARLVFRALQGFGVDQYCLEFEQMSARRGFEGARDLALAFSGAPLLDWFQWNNVLADLAAFGPADQLGDVLGHVAKIFPGSPNLDVVNMHHAIDTKHWPGALAAATKLHASFPHHRDYGFMKALSANQNGDLDLALATLRGLGEHLNEIDADIMHLYGEVLALKALETDNETLAAQATAKLERAARIYRRQGKEIDAALTMIQRLERNITSAKIASAEAPAFRAPRSWMVMLTPEQYATLATSGDQDISVLHRPMGKDAMPGDIVLFVSKSAHVAKQPATSAQEWRIVAVYRVATRPYWHPVNRWQNGLELVDRPDAAIPVDAKEVSSDWNVRGKKYSLPRGHHARYGVFELDDSAMDIVVSAVKRRSEGISHEQDRRGAAFTKKDSI